MTHVFTSAQALLDAEGMDLGRTDWLSISQQRINLFADATGDHQWIHVDPERAASGPFGACIAHGYLTQALANLFMPQLMRVENLAMGVNYGCDRVRFPAPVAVGSRVRGHAHQFAQRSVVRHVAAVAHCDVGTVHLGDLVDDGEEPFGVEIAERHPGTFVGEQVGRGPTHARGRAGDQHPLTGHTARQGREPTGHAARQVERPLMPYIRMMTALVGRSTANTWVSASGPPGSNMARS